MGWFEAVEAAISGWDADGAAPIGAEGDGDQSCGYGVGGATRGTAGIVVGVMRVERGTTEGVVICRVCITSIHLELLGSDHWAMDFT